MYCRIAERYKYCVAGERVILLDVQAGRYIGVTAARETVIITMLCENGACDPKDPNVRDMIAAGILEKTASSYKPRCQAELEAPILDLLDRVEARSSALRFGRALFWEFRITRQLRKSSFAVVIDQAVRIRPRTDFSPAEEGKYVEDVAAACRKVGLILGRTDRCLVQSLAMFCQFKALNVAVRLVVAVRAHPFTAHCWVQRDGLVLNDLAEHARTFTPIWVVE